MKAAIKPGNVPKTMMSISGSWDGIARQVWHREDYMESLRVIAKESSMGWDLWSFGQKERKDWMACQDAAELMENFRRGKPGLIAPELLAEVSRLALHHLEKRAGVSSEFAQAGDEPDVSLFLSGEPECMIRTTWECERPSVTLHFMPGVSFDVEQGAMVSHGLAVSAAIMALEAAGYAVELIAWDVMHPMPWQAGHGRWPDDTPTGRLRKPRESKRKSGDADPDNVGGIIALRKAGWETGYCGHGIILKESNESISAAEMGFYLCHPSFVRAAIYCLAHPGDGSVYSETSCMVNGFPVTWEKELKNLSEAYEKINGCTSRGVWLPTLDYGFVTHRNSAENAADTAVKMLEKMGFIEKSR